MSSIVRSSSWSGTTVSRATHAPGDTDRRVEAAAAEVARRVEGSFHLARRELFDTSAEHIAGRLRACVDGPVIDFANAGLSELELTVLTHLDPGVWHALADFARAKGSKPTCVRLPALPEGVLESLEDTLRSEGMRIEVADTAPAIADSKQGAPADPRLLRDALVAALPEPTAALLTKGGIDSAGFADKLLALRQGDCFDASKLAGPMADALLALPAAAWRVLREHAAADGTDITWVKLPASSFLDEFQLADGLNELRSLTHVEFATVPGQAEINFKELALPSLRTIDVRHGAGSFNLSLPSALQSVKVHASSPSTQRLGSTLRFVEEEGRVAKQTAMPGLIYRRRPTDFMVDPDTGRELAEEEAQARVRLFDANQEVEFQPEPGRDFPMDGRLIQCRHLTIHWCEQRRQHLSAEGADGKGLTASRFSYESMGSTERVASSVSLQTESTYWQTLWQGPEALIHVDQLGDWVAAELRSMKAEGRTFSHFLSEPGGMHAMGIELQVKPDGRYVVNMYEPGVTASHLRCVVHDPARLQALGLVHWCGVGVIERLFENTLPDGARIAALYRLDPAACAKDPTPLQRKPPVVRAGEKHVGTPQFLYHALRSGDAKSVDASVRGILADPDFDPARLRGISSDRHGIAGAIFLDRAEGLGAYTQAILDSKRLDAPAQTKLLNAETTKEGVLGLACAWGRPAVVRGQLESILKSSRLPDAVRIELLAGRGCKSREPNAIELAIQAGRVDVVKSYMEAILDPANGLTGKQRLQILRLSAALRCESQAAREAMQAYDAAILAAPDEALSLQERQQVLETVVDDALDRNDGAAVKLHVDCVLTHPALDASSRRACLGSREVHRAAHASGHADAVLAFVSSLLQQPDALDRDDWLELLAGSGSVSSGEPAFQQMLADCAFDSKAAGPAREVLYTRLLATCTSDVLTASEKAAIFASPGVEEGEPTLVQKALQIDPHTAGAIVAAWVASPLDTKEGSTKTRDEKLDDKFEILNELGASVGRVLRTLLKSPGAGQPWTWMILQSLDASGLDKSTIERYRRQFEPEFLRRMKLQDPRA